MKKVLFWTFCLTAFRVVAQPSALVVSNADDLGLTLASSPLVGGTIGNKALKFRVFNGGPGSLMITGLTVSGIGSAHVARAAISSFSADGILETIRFSNTNASISESNIVFSGGSGIEMASQESIVLYLVIKVKPDETLSTGTTATLVLSTATGGVSVNAGNTVSQTYEITKTYSFISSKTTVSVIDAGRPQPTGISYSMYHPGDNSRTALFGIKFTDAGHDALPTRIASLTFSITNSGNLATAGLYSTDGSQAGTDVTVSGTNGTVTFTGNPLFTVSNGVDKTIWLKASFANNVTDNQYINVALTSGTITLAAGSALAPIGTDIKTNTDVTNKINVAATAQRAVPAAINAEAGAEFELSIRVTDNAGNIDRDYGGSAAISISGTPPPGTVLAAEDGLTQSFSDGWASWAATLTPSGSYTLTSTVAGLPAITLTANISGASVSHAAVSDTPAYCSNGGFRSIGDITITENTNNDFAAGTRVTLILLLPSGFVFDSGVRDGLAAERLVAGQPQTTSDIFIPNTCYAYRNNNSVVIIRFTVFNTLNRERLHIRGLRVRYPGESPAQATVGDIVRIGGTAVIRGLNTQGVLAKLTAADAANSAFGSRAAAAPTFEAMEGNGVSLGQTTFDIGTPTVNIQVNPAISTANVISGQGITIVSGSTPAGVTFSPQRVGEGGYLITYKIRESRTGQDCHTKTVKTFTVVRSFVGLADTYCSNTPRGTVSLLASRKIGETDYTLSSLGYRVWNGTAFADPIRNIPTVAAGDNRTFTFPLADFPADGVRWELGAVYRSAGNQIFETQKQVTFRTAPTVTFANPRNGNFCNTETAEIALTGTPGGGTFSGPGISAGTSMFTPRNVPAANQGSPEGVRLSYTVTSGGGCTVTSSFTCGVYPPPVARFVPQNSPYCKDGEGDVSVTFSNTSTSVNTDIRAVTWSFGDGGTSSLLSGQHPYRAAGTYNVTLTVTGEGGCIHSYTAPIIIGTMPNPNITNLNNEAKFCSTQLSGNGKEIILNTSTGKNEYKIGDGDIWSDIGTSNAFYLREGTAQNPGNYWNRANTATRISYRNTQDGSNCSAVKEITVTAYTPPTLSFTPASGTYYCKTDAGTPVSVNFTSTVAYVHQGIEALALAWNFGDPSSAEGFVNHNISAVANPSHAYSATGDYQVTLTARGAGNCSATREAAVRIRTNPGPTITISNATATNDTYEFCSSDLSDGGKLVALNISTGTNQYKIEDASLANGDWVTMPGNANTFKLKNTTAVAPDFHYSSAYINRTVRITYKNTADLSGCTASKVITVMAYAPPTVNFTTNANAHNALCRLLNEQEILQPVTALFTNATSYHINASDETKAATTWHWNFGVSSAGAGNESTARDGAYPYSAAGTYSILLEATGKGGCRSEIRKSIIVGNTPNPKFLTTSNDFCSDGLADGIALNLNLATGANSFSVNNGPYLSIATSSSIRLVNRAVSSEVPGEYDYRGQIGQATVIKYKNVEPQGRCEKEVSKTITVYKPPTPAFDQGSTHLNSSGKPVLCLPLGTDPNTGNTINTYKDNLFEDKSTAAANNNSGVITSRHWDFGDNAELTTTQTEVWHRYTSYNTNGKVTLKIGGSGGCERTLTKDLLIGRTPNPKFLSANFYNNPPHSRDLASYCENELVRGIPVNLSLAEGTNAYCIKEEENMANDFKSIGNNRTFTLYSESYTGLTSSSDYLLGDSKLDKRLYIVYKNTEAATECTNLTSGRFTVHKLIPVSFSIKDDKGLPVNHHCLLKTGDLGTNFRVEVPPGYISRVNDTTNWDFGDGSSRAAKKSDVVNHKYTLAKGAYSVRLEITDNISKCKSSHVADFPVAYKPVPDFHASKLCEGEGTEFTFTTALMNETARTKASCEFDFGDSEPPRRFSLNADTWEGGVVTSPYAAHGRYLVKLTVKDSIMSGGRYYSCKGFTTPKAVGIVPQITDKDHLESFDNQGGFWIAQGWVNNGEPYTDWNFDAQDSWPPSSTGGNRFWLTRRNEEYKPLQRSALYSPCFDLRARGYYPIMSFDYFSQLPDQKDGVCLEYSYDGVRWESVGNNDLGYGRNWYNQSAIGGLSKRNLPDGAYGQETAQIGWSGKSHGWVTAKYDLSNPLYKQKIRFRFLFGTNDDNKIPGENGFALDNFRLYPRNATILGEHFLHKDSVTDPEKFFEFGKTDTLFIKLAYLTAPGNSGDLEYFSNTADPDARATYYGVSSPPWSFINGFNEYKTEIDISTWGKGVFNDKILDKSPIEIADIKAELTAQSRLVISAVLHASVPVQKGTWVVHAALVENVNGRQIMRKFLPNAAGTPLTATETQDQKFSETCRWEKGNNIKDPSEAGVIIFVQNLDTKSVMQAAYKSLKNLPPPTIAGFENYSNEAALYPNPAKAHFYLELPFSQAAGVTMTVTNMAGQAIEVPYTHSGRQIKADISALAEGIYVVEARSEKGIVQKKLAIAN